MTLHTYGAWDAHHALQSRVSIASIALESHLNRFKPFYPRFNLVSLGFDRGKMILESSRKLATSDGILASSDGILASSDGILASRTSSASNSALSRFQLKSEVKSSFDFVENKTKSNESN